MIAIDEGEKWLLSPYGDTHMTKLLAVRKRASPVDETSVGEFGA